MEFLRNAINKLPEVSANLSVLLESAYQAVRSGNTSVETACLSLLDKLARMAEDAEMDVPLALLAGLRRILEFVFAAVEFALESCKFVALFIVKHVISVLDFGLKALTFVQDFQAGLSATHRMNVTLPVRLLLAAAQTPLVQSHRMDVLVTVALAAPFLALATEVAGLVLPPPVARVLVPALLSAAPALLLRTFWPATPPRLVLPSPSVSTTPLVASATWTEFLRQSRRPSVRNFAAILALGIYARL